MQRHHFKFQSLSLALLLSLGCLSGPDSPESIRERRARQESSKSEDGTAPESDQLLAESDMADEQGEAPMEDLGSADGAAAQEPRGEQTSSKKAKAAAAQDSLKEELAGEERGGSREVELLKELRKDRSLKLQRAEYHVKKGDELFSQGRNEEAVIEYQSAVDLDPLNDDARVKLNRAKILLGDRGGEIGTIATELIEAQRARTEQQLSEIRRRIDDGEAALKDKEPEKAERSFSQAVDMIHVQPEIDAALRQRATDGLRRAKDDRLALKKAREDEIAKQTEQIALKELNQSNAVKSAQVQELLRKAAEFMRQHDYEKVVEACERVQRIDPDNRVAKFWLHDAQDQIVQERRMRLIKNRFENTGLTAEDFTKALVSQDKPFEFPDEPDWVRIQGRAKTQGMLDVSDPEPIRRIKNAMNVIVDFAFDKTPLGDVVQQLRTVTGAKIGVDPAVDESGVLVTGMYQGLPAISVLNLVLESVGLSYTFKENILFVTNPGPNTGNVVFGIYNVSDILNKIREFSGPELILRPSGDTGESPISFTASTEEDDSQLDPEKLQELIKSSTGGDSAWADPVKIEFHGGQFLVNAPRELHAEIQTVLENLRKDSDLFVVIEARFIDINDDFLEDIGIDSRALGLANNYGTPYGNVVNDGRTGGQDLGFVKQGSPVRDVTLIMGQDRWAGRVRHIIDGFTGTIRGERLTGGQGISGLTLQSTFLEPFQLNTILRAVQEKLNVRQLTAPVVTAHNGQRVFVSVITQRAYIADYNLVSGGTGFAIIEVADPEVQTFQEGVILDVDPVISHDKRYVTLDVRPTLATLIGGVISTILISLGSFTNVANQVPIGVPEISLQQSFTSVTVPNGGTVLLGGFKSLNETKLTSYLPILGKIPIIGNLFRRKSQIAERRSLVILLTARIVDLRESESRQFNAE